MVGFLVSSCRKDGPSSSSLLHADSLSASAVPVPLLTTVIVDGTSSALSAFTSALSAGLVST